MSKTCKYIGCEVPSINGCIYIVCSVDKLSQWFYDRNPCLSTGIRKKIATPNFLLPTQSGLFCDKYRSRVGLSCYNLPLCFPMDSDIRAYYRLIFDLITFGQQTDRYQPITSGLVLQMAAVTCIARGHSSQTTFIRLYFFCN